MSKAKVSLERTIKDISRHEFDSSSYIVLKPKIVRPGENEKKIQRSRSGKSIKMKPCSA